MTRSKVVVLAAAGLLLGGMPGQHTAEEIAVSAIRFYRAEAGLTQVKAFVQVPLGLLTPSSDARLVYQVSVQLKDSTGLTLAEDAWPMQHVPAQMQEPGAFTVSSIEFNIRPGRYLLEATVRDSVTGRDVSAHTGLAGYDSMPPASDLVLSSRMRAWNGDSVVQPTEWRNGQILVTSIAHVRLNPTSPEGSRIFYLLEVYSAAPDSGTMQVSIMDSSGKVFVRTAPTPVQLAAGGGVLRGQMNLEGLPSGDYSAQVAVTLGDRTVRRAAEFSVADLQQELQRQAELAAADRLTDEGYFGAMSEEELDAAKEPLEYIASGRELRAYDGASLVAKRRFLTEFWKQRDPDTTDLRNPVREQFYGQITYADSAFRERGAFTQSGWKTDRGRIFAKYGAPDEVHERLHEGRAPTYQIWRYTRRRDTWYIFADRTGLGSFKLMHTNDRSEVGLPGWREILTQEAVREIGLYLGVDFFTSDQR